jgi:hypothetical protein
MTDPFGFHGKRVVVTGGVSGVGAALVELPAAQEPAPNTNAHDAQHKKPPSPVGEFPRTELPCIYTTPRHPQVQVTRRQAIVRRSATP